MNIRLLITVTWMVLVGLLITRNVFIPTLDTDLTAALAKAREESYYGIWFQNQRIGFVENRIQPADQGTFSLDQRARLRLNILNQTRQIDMHLNADLNAQQQLRQFSFSFRSPFYTMDAQGKVDGGTLQLTTESGGDRRKETIVLDEAPFISTNQRGYLLTPMPELGQQIKIPFFDPLTLSSRQTQVTYRGKEKLLIKKRIYRLHHFESRFSGVRINFWIDDQGKMIKEESPAGFVFLSEPEFKAHEIEGGESDLLRAVAVPYSGQLPDETSAFVEYHLELPSNVVLDIDGGRQQFRDGRLRITHERHHTEPKVSAVQCNYPESAIKASRFVQSDHAEIVAQAEKISTSDNRREIIRALAAWVYANIDKRPVIGLPDALATMHNRQGDCNEHAALFAALARSRGIPTRIAAGVTLHQGRFYYHAWNEVCIDGHWLSLDTTKNQIPADLTHIRLVSGDLEDQLRIGAVLGHLEIEVLE